MKRKLQKLTTKELHNLFNEHFATSHLSNELLYMLSERKQRSFIIEKFLTEFTIIELTKILEDYF